MNLKYAEMLVIVVHEKMKLGDKGRYTLGDKLLQHVAATDHSMCTGRATSGSNKVRRQIASCVPEKFCENLCLRNRILSLQQVAKNQIRMNLCDLLRRQILLQRQRFSQKFSSTQEAICRCNLSPSVYRP